MKNICIIFGVLFLVMIIAGGPAPIAVQAADQTKDAHVEPDRHHDEHDDHDSDRHQDEQTGSGVKPEAADDGHDDEESEAVELTGAQQKEIGLALEVARAGDIEHLISLVGEVRLHEDRLAHLVPRVEGIVRQVKVKLGENVREGQILAIIDSSEFAELKADYLEKLRHLDLTRRTYERKQFLKQENIASEADWQEAQAAFQNAETRLLSAKRRLIFLGLGEEEINDLPAADDAAFGRYQLQSPFAGTIIAKHITRGEKIGAEEVFTVADLSVVWVDLQIPAQDLNRVKQGQGVEITSTEGRSAAGKLIMVGPVVDRESRTALGRIELPNPDGYWKPGLFVKGLIQSETAASGVVVPSEAIQNIDGENFVFVPDDHGFLAREVTLGKSASGRTEILSGLKAGERYVTKGAFALKAVKVTSGLGGHAGHGH
jgi:cobalt-zinc-cadmium efflux system membrane fusion protein